MRLINTTTFELKDFGAAPPLYAILSHTWGEEEVTFQDMADLDGARQKKGFAKIEQCCRRARRDSLSWAWVDTCCIDKTSSAELSETINSMFQWYERAIKCYAFLEDIWARPGDELFAGLDPDAAHEALGIRDTQSSHGPVLFGSRWWTRGWTLQELIAPLDVEFFNRDWEFLTSKRACSQLISVFCGIADSILAHSTPLSSICVAERISWASERTTTRDEDMAYCLLGILGVNMPLLYGEGGHKAFLRLQEQLIATTEDYTLFLWGLSGEPSTSPSSHIRHTSDRALPTSGSSAPFESILAASPRDFARGQAWSHWVYADMDSLRLGEPPQITSRGLRASLFIKEVTTLDLKDGTSELSRLLFDFFKWILRPKHPELVARLQPNGILLPYTVFLGAFPLPAPGTGSHVLPCILLPDLESFGYPITKGNVGPGSPFESRKRPPTYARFSSLFHKLPATQVSIGNGWENKDCFIKTRTDSEMRQLGLQLRQPGPSHKVWNNLWVWRTAHADIPFFPLHGGLAQVFGQRDLHSIEDVRACCMLQSTERRPGCVISVAVRSGHYWIGVRVGKAMGHNDLRFEAQQLAFMDLDQMWTTTSRETGPICEKQVIFGDGVLVITLYIERSGIVRVYLALVEGGEQ
jgi:hypothetical protein